MSVWVIYLNVGEDLMEGLEFRPLGVVAPALAPAAGNE